MVNNIAWALAAANIAATFMLYVGQPQDPLKRYIGALSLGLLSMTAAAPIHQAGGGVVAAFLISSLGSLLVLWSIIGGISAFVNRNKKGQARSGSGNQSDSGHNSPASLYPARKPRYTLGDIQGMVELKNKLDHAWGDVVNNGKNGILFGGPPGNGKTFISEALAGAMGCSFLEARIGEIASKWVNQTTEQINTIFLAARWQAPCMLFLDEIDSVLRNRADLMGMGDAEAPRIVNALLTNIADVHSHPEWQVLVVAATNHMDHLDGAGIREGRFDFKIEIPPPDFEARVGLLKNNLPKGYTFEEGVAERAAKRWEGFSVIRIITVAERAARFAGEAGSKKIGFRTLMAALRDVQGARGLNLPEGTPSLDELKFDEDIRAELRGLANRMTNVEQIEARGGTIPKGVVFGGPPGTGKTAVAKALAIASGWAFLPTTGQELQSAPESLDKIIDKALDLRPAIVFIDEADDILQDRAASPWTKASTNKLLAVLDGAKALPDVMFVAATNAPETLDAAAIRDGRFGEKYIFRNPSQETVEHIIEMFMKEKSMAPWAADFTPQAAAALMEGLAPADVRGRLQAAINRVAGDDHAKVTLGTLQRVLQ